MFVTFQAWEGQEFLSFLKPGKAMVRCFACSWFKPGKAHDALEIVVPRRPRPCASTVAVGA